MHSMYHALRLIKGDREAVFERTLEWLGNSKFRIDVQDRNRRIVAIYAGWHGFGMTDGQTASELEILLEDTNGQTAVSVCHRTRQFFVLAGAMCGNILEREAGNLLTHLQQRIETA